MPSSWANFNKSGTLLIGTFTMSGLSAVPALPGATKMRLTALFCATFQAKACSRPPPPMTRIFMLLPLMPKMPYAGHYHDQAVLVCCRHHFFVAHAATRVDHAAGTGFGQHVYAVTEWEEGIGGHHRIFKA